MRDTKWGKPMAIELTNELLTKLRKTLLKNFPEDITQGTLCKLWEYSLTHAIEKPLELAHKIARFQVIDGYEAKRKQTYVPCGLMQEDWSDRFTTQGPEADWFDDETEFELRCYDKLSPRLKHYYRNRVKNSQTTIDEVIKYVVGRFGDIVLREIVSGLDNEPSEGYDEEQEPREAD